MPTSKQDQRINHWTLKKNKFDLWACPVDCVQSVHVWCVNAVSSVALARLSVMCSIDVAYVGVGVPTPMVTFDLCHASPALTLAYPNPSTSVNELEDPSASAGSVQLEGSLSVKGW